VIPCLLVDEDGMVKTIAFGDRTYLGDPINIINLFNRFEVDEICLLDISATGSGRGPQFDLIERLASECWVPLAYGGGIRSLDDAREILAVGVEKVVLGAIAADAPSTVSAISSTFGAQATVVAVDARHMGKGRYEVFVDGGSRGLRTDPASYARRAESLGAGEILLTSIDSDGSMNGYDLELIAQVTAAVEIPVIACGGAGSRSDLAIPIKKAGAAAVAAGSIFVYQGRERGVLVNFPERELLEQLLS
jgi:cyclase